MSVIHVRQIRAALDKEYKPFIDLADVEAKPKEQQDACFATRALSAYALSIVSGAKPEAAAKAVVDGPDDNGIDAILFDEVEKKLFVVQSKWNTSGDKTPELGEVQKYIQGIRDLLNLTFDRFNKKVTSLGPAIQAALEEPATRLVLILAHTSTSELGQHAVRVVSDLLGELNDPSEVATFECIGQKQLHAALTRSAEGTPINIEAVLSDWGQLREPYQAFYGQISAADIGEWHLQHHDRLFAKNLRKVIINSEINKSITETIRTTPEIFWYFNNGITVLCERVKKKLQGGADTASGIFSCEGISVVNGAQTVGSIAAAYLSDPERTKQAKVSIRFISLESCPEDFAVGVTRATNTQNRVESKDFAALDPEQDRIRRELLLDGKAYAYKTGEPAPLPENGCTVDEATIALACARPDVGLAVMAKSNIGKLWENIDKPPYVYLFNNKLSGVRVWRMVALLRAVDEALRQEQKERTGKQRAVAVHGNRFITHQVFARLPLAGIEEQTFDIDGLTKKAKALTPQVSDLTAVAIDALFPTAYVQSLFKNATKCTELTEKMAALAGASN